MQVFVAFKNGVAHVLPEFATSLIRALGAEPAEWVDVGPISPALEVVTRRGARGFVAGGSSIKRGLSSLTLWEEERRHKGRPEQSWKSHRTNRWRRVATATA